MSPPMDPTVKVLAEEGPDPLQTTHEIPAEASTGRTRRVRVFLSGFWPFLSLKR